MSITRKWQYVNHAVIIFNHQETWQRSWISNFVVIPKLSNNNYPSQHKFNQLDHLDFMKHLFTNNELSNTDSYGPHQTLRSMCSCPLKAVALTLRCSVPWHLQESLQPWNGLFISASRHCQPTPKLVSLRESRYMKNASWMRNMGI